MFLMLDGRKCYFGVKTNAMLTHPVFTQLRMTKIASLYTHLLLEGRLSIPSRLGLKV